MKKILIALAAVASLGAAAGAPAQSSGTVNMSDQEQQLVSQIQSDKRAIVLSTLGLTDAEVAAFTPIYDKYQADRKLLMQRGVDLINAYSSNYDSMTDAAAKGLLKDWFKLQEDELALVQGTAKKLDKVLPTARVLRFVQVENKLNTLLRLPGIQGIPLAK